MAGGPRKPDEGVLPWEFVLVLWAGATVEEEKEEEEFSKAKGIFLPRRKGGDLDQLVESQHRHDRHHPH